MYFYFAVQGAARLLASACASTQSNLEMADAHLFNPHCHCGWTGTLVGLVSVKHYVEPWESPSPVAKESDSCDGKIEHSPAA